jgi:Fe-S-cluster containining protein
MADRPEAPSDPTIRVALTVGDTRISADITVPAAEVPLAALLPVFRGFAEILIGRAVEREREQGRSVSCRKGCGACCRQLVPISEIEARQIRDLVTACPPSRRDVLRARFDAARQRLEEAGLLEKLVHPERFSNEELTAETLGLPYFRLGIACPFLEEESCSIYPEWPIACREYLVTSPAQYCADLGRAEIEGVPLARKVSAVLQRIGMTPARRFVRWVPLILAWDWADDHPDDLGSRPGPEWLREFFTLLTGQAVPALALLPGQADGAG